MRVQLPLAHRRRALQRVMLGRHTPLDASSLTQEPIDGTTRTRQSLAPSGQLRIAGQIVEQGFGSRRPPQAFGGLIAHLEQAVDHHLADALRWVLARPRLAVQDGFILRRRFPQALAPFLDPAFRHAHCLSIVLARPGGVLGQHTTQVGTGGIVYCFHERTLLGRRRISYQECTLLFLALATMYVTTQGYDVSNSYKWAQHDRGGPSCPAAA